MTRQLRTEFRVRRWGLILGLVLLCSPHPSLAQPTCPPPEMAPEGGWPTDPAELLAALEQSSREALAEKNPDRARTLTSCALALAPDDDPDRRANLLFRQAVAEQTAGTARGASCEDQLAVLGTYREVRALKPEAPAVYYNMARVLDSPCATPERADVYYRRAAALEGDTPGFFTLALAEFLAKTEPREAEALYIRLALTPPHNAEAHSRLRSIFLRQPLDRTDDLAHYLWQLLRSGATIEAQETALDALELGLRKKNDRVEFLTLIVAGLSQSYMSPKDFQTSELRARLLRLRGDLALAQGVTELLGIYEAAAERWTDLRNAEVPWWSRQGDPRRDPDRGIWPRDAMQSLLRGLGRWFERDDQAEVAETCLRLAATLTPDDPDPLAFRDLTEFYLRNEGEQAFARIENLINDFGDPLFEGKGGAYRDGRLADIYEYHRTLGQMYGHLAANGRAEWGNSRDPRSAIFQLERAYQVGQQLDRQARGKGVSEPSHLDIGTTTLLIQGYSATSETADARRIYSDAMTRIEERDDQPADVRLKAIMKLNEAVAADPEIRYAIEDTPDSDRVIG